MNLSRIRRLVQLLGILQGGRGRNVAALSAECQVSRRTIFRDLDVLRQAGVPLLYSETEQHYCIPGTYYLPPTNFTGEEALAIMILCHELGDGRLPFYHAARQAAVKLESSLPARLRDYLRQVSAAVSIKLSATTRLASGEPLYQQLVEAISVRRAVRITYASVAEGASICTRLAPYRLLFSRHSWYVIGRSSLHRSVRTFNVGRISRLEQLSDPYTIPRGFSIDRHLRNAWHLIPGQGPDRKVTVRFSPLVARNVAEVSWHKTQRTEFLPDGRLDFHVTVSGIDEIAWWILGYGDQAEVIEPKELRTLIRHRAQRLLAQYET